MIKTIGVVSNELNSSFIAGYFCKHYFESIYNLLKIMNCILKQKIIFLKIVRI